MTSITIVGRVGGDPDLRFTGAGSAVASFTVAVNRRRKDGDKWVDDGTDWHTVSAWRTLAESCAESLHKGTEVVVVGTLKSRDYEAKDGSKRTVWEITADHIGIALPRFERRETGGWSKPNAADPWATPNSMEAPF